MRRVDPSNQIPLLALAVPLPELKVNFSTLRGGGSEVLRNGVGKLRRAPFVNRRKPLTIRGDGKRCDTGFRDVGAFRRDIYRSSVCAGKGLTGNMAVGSGIESLHVRGRGARAGLIGGSSEEKVVGDGGVEDTRDTKGVLVSSVLNEGLDSGNVGGRLQLGGGKVHDRVIREGNGVGSPTRRDNDVRNVGTKMGKELLVASFKLPKNQYRLATSGNNIFT